MEKMSIKEDNVVISHTEYELMKSQIQYLMEQLKLSKHHRFGASSEKSEYDQINLFNEAEVYAEPLAAEPTLSMDNTVTISRKEPNEIFEIVERLSDKNVKVSDIFLTYYSIKARKNSQPQSSIAAPKKKTQITIKDTPVYDPDAQVSSLSYTIPSWVVAIEKVFLAADFGKTSMKARYRLRKELVVLADAAEIVLGFLKEDI